MKQAEKELFEAVKNLKADKVKAAIAQGCDLEATNAQGETVMDWILNMYEEEEDRFGIVEILLQAGANVNRRIEFDHGYASAAIIDKDMRLLKLLLDHGYDPNIPSTAYETVYDWALADYIFDYWENGFPVDPTDNETSSTDRYLGYLEKLAKEHKVPPPIFLRELRKAGALSYRELEDLGLV